MEKLDNHSTIIEGLKALGFESGWALVNGDYENMHWELESQKPFLKDVLKAAETYAANEKAKKTAAQEKLTNLGITEEELKIILS